MSFAVFALPYFASENCIVFPAFLAQYAAGCFLAVAASAIRQCGWQYLRLMAIVSTAIAVLAAVFLIREAGGLSAGSHLGAVWGLVAGAGFGFVWLFVNAAQGEKIGWAQRLCPAAAGAACLAAAVSLAIPSGPASIAAEAAWRSSIASSPRWWRNILPHQFGGVRLGSGTLPSSAADRLPFASP